MKKLLTILLMLPFAAIAQVKYIPLNGHTKQMPDTDKKGLTVYLDKSKLNGKQYEEIGLIVCKTNRDTKAFRKAKKKAAKYGADALYLYNEKDRTNGEKAMNTLLLTNYKDEMKFIAVKLE